MTSGEVCDIITSSDRVLSDRTLSDKVIFLEVNTMYNSFNQWNTAAMLYGQLNAKDRLEFKMAEAVVNFIKFKLKGRKKHA